MWLYTHNYISKYILYDKNDIWRRDTTMIILIKKNYSLKRNPASAKFFLSIQTLLYVAKN